VPVPAGAKCENGVVVNMACFIVMHQVDNFVSVLTCSFLTLLYLYYCETKLWLLVQKQKCKDMIYRSNLQHQQKSRYDDDKTVADNTDADKMITDNHTLITTRLTSPTPSDNISLSKEKGMSQKLFAITIFQQYLTSWFETKSHNSKN